MNEVINPFSNCAVATVPNSTRHDVEGNRAIAEVQAMVVLAKRFPRNAIECVDRILTECQRQGLAEQALYSYSRGGTEITGPSIRLAEAIARNWHNLDFGVKELSQESGKSEMMAYCWDLETNVRNTKIFQVKHERSTKKGSYKLEDSRDIYEVTANNAARRVRSAILATIPGDVVEAAVKQCEETLRAKADTSPEALKKLIEAFDTFKVTKEQIEKRIQRRLDAITPAQVVGLRKIYNSLKDGMSGPADWFETNEPVETKADDLKATLKNRKEKEIITEPEATETEPENLLFGDNH